jgi:hypothetical protein
MAAVVLFAPQVLNDGDTYWHVATGDWILAHGRAPDHDVFSYSRPGVPWIAHEWLSEVLMAMARRAAGWGGVVALFAIAVGAATWLLVRRLSLRLGGVSLIAVALLSLACTSGSLLARPHLFMLPLLVIWTIELMTAREQGRAPRLVFALMMTAWANLHGSYVFGFVVAGAFGLEALLEPGADRIRVMRDWGLFGVASLACALITPHGLAGLIYPFQVMGMTILPHIAEWRAEDFSHISPFQITLFAGLFVCLSRGVKLPTLRLLLLLGLLFMSLQHERHQLVLAVVAPLILAEPLALALGQRPQRARTSPRLWIGFGVACAVLLGLRLALPLPRVDGLNSPVTAVEHVPAELAAQPVLNEYGFGGYLIFKGIRPFIDGRADMYGNAFSADYFRATNVDTAALEKLTRDYHVAWTLFAPDNPTVAALDANPAWRRIYADPHAVIHRRVAAAHGPD